MTVKVDYRLSGYGWAECVVDIAGQRRKVTASYLSEALANLLNAANLLLSGEIEVKFHFDEEPGEYCWILRRSCDDCLTVMILWFPEIWGTIGDSEGKVIFEADCPAQNFCRAVAVAASDVLDENGLQGYRNEWGSAFPEEEYLALCNRLGHPPSSRVIRKGHRRTDNNALSMPVLRRASRRAENRLLPEPTFAVWRERWRERYLPGSYV